MDDLDEKRRHLKARIKMLSELAKSQAEIVLRYVASAWHLPAICVAVRLPDEGVRLLVEHWMKGRECPWSPLLRKPSAGDLASNWTEEEKKHDATEFAACAGSLLSQCTFEEALDCVDITIARMSGKPASVAIKYLYGVVRGRASRRGH